MRSKGAPVWEHHLLPEVFGRCPAAMRCAALVLEREGHGRGGREHVQLLPLLHLGQVFEDKERIGGARVCQRRDCVGQCSRRPKGKASSTQLLQGELREKRAVDFLQ